MAIMTDRQSVAANTTIPNALSGKSAEFVQEPSVVRLYATASAVGMNMTLIIGEEVVLDDQEVNAQNRMPLTPDDFVCEGGAFPGDRITLRLRNTTGGAVTAFSKVEVVPA